jgi:hypothetical protein
VASRIAGPHTDTIGDDQSSWLGAGQDVTVDATGPVDVTLDLQPLLTLRGRMHVVAGASNKPSRISVGLIATPEAGSDTTNWRNSATVRDDGAFYLTDTLPGRYTAGVLFGSGAPSPWHISSATIDGRDALDLLFEMSAASVATQRLDVTVTDQHSTISGRLDVASGGAGSDFQIVAFAADDRYWVPQSHRLGVVRVNADGTYRVQDLPAGDYLLGVVTADVADDVRSPDFLKQLAPAAVRVTVRDGETTTQNLRVR